MARSHPDHVRVSKLVLQLRPLGRLAFYADQPYAMWLVLGAGTTAGRGRRGNAVDLAVRRRRASGLLEPRVPEGLGAGDVRWEVVARSTRAWARKQRAIRCYRSQLRAYGHVTPAGLVLYEAAAGGEAIGWR